MQKQPSAKPLQKKNTPAKAKKPSRQPANAANLIPVQAANDDAGRLLTSNILVLGALLLMIVIAFSSAWYAMHKKFSVIAITESGAIINPVPLNEVYAPPARVVAFVDRCIRDAFSHDFENFRKTVTEAKTCFTDQGAKGFQDAIDPLLETIEKKRLVMTVTTEPPSITRGPYLYMGRVMWDVSAIITLYFQGTTERYPVQQRSATITIVRTPLESNPRGIAVDNIQLAPFTGRYN